MGQRIDRINNELKRLEERDLIDEKEEDDDVEDTNDLIDQLFDKNEIELPKPRSTPRGWRDQFNNNDINSENLDNEQGQQTEQRQEDDVGEEEEEAGIIMNE